MRWASPLLTVVFVVIVSATTLAVAAESPPVKPTLQKRSIGNIFKAPAQFFKNARASMWDPKILAAVEIASARAARHPSWVNKKYAGFTKFLAGGAAARNSPEMLAAKAKEAAELAKKQSKIYEKEALEYKRNIVTKGAGPEQRKEAIDNYVKGMEKSDKASAISQMKKDEAAFFTFIGKNPGTAKGIIEATLGKSTAATSPTGLASAFTQINSLAKKENIIKTFKVLQE